MSKTSRDEVRLREQLNLEYSCYKHRDENAKQENQRAYYFLLSFRNQLKCETTTKPKINMLYLEILAFLILRVKDKDYVEVIDTLYKISIRFGLLPRNVKTGIMVALNSIGDNYELDSKISK